MPLVAPTTKPLISGDSWISRVLNFLASQDLSVAARGLTPTGMTYLKPEVVTRLVQQFKSGGASTRIGEGVDAFAKVVKDPEIGDVVIKQLKDPGYMLAGSELPLRQAIELMDRLYPFAVKTQRVSHDGGIYLIQPLVRVVRGVSKEQYYRLINTLDKIAAKRGIRLTDVSRDNIILGKAEGRTRPFVVDVGSVTTRQGGEAGGWVPRGVVTSHRATTPAGLRIEEAVAAGAAIPAAQRVDPVAGPMQATPEGKDDYGMLAQITGLPRELVQQRWEVLRRLVPDHKTADDFRAWYGNLNGIDKLMMVLQPGQPLLRDFYVARRLVHGSEWYKQFTADPANKDFLQRYYGEGISRGTPQQEEFVARVGRDTRQMVQSGRAYQEFQSQGFWRSAADDFITSLPYIVVAPLGVPMRLFTRLAAPVVGAVGRGVGAVARFVAPETAAAVSRQFMRLSVAVPDLMAAKVLKELENMRPRFKDSAAFDAFLEKSKTTVMQMRNGWADRFAAQQAADGEAHGRILFWRQTHGVDNRHFNVVEEVLAKKDTIWREWQGVHSGAQKGIVLLREQAAAAPTPQVRAALLARADVLQTQLLNSVGVYTKRIQNVTTDSVIQGLNLPGWTAVDTQKAAALGQDVLNHMRTLYPAGTPGFRPFYFPEFNSASLKKSLQTVPVGAAEFYKLERAGAAVSLTGDESVRRLHQRMAIPAWIKADDANVLVWQKFVADTATNFEPEIAAGLRSSLNSVGVDLLDQKTLSGLTGTALSWWKQAVLIGRLPAWVSINTLGNFTNTAMYLMDNWLKGRFVNPVDMLRRMNVPLYVLEGQSAALSVGGIVAGRDIAGRPLLQQVGAVARGVAMGHIRAAAYATNNIIEMGFRSAIYKTEVKQVLKELARDGVSPVDAYQLAAKKGWEATNRIMYNYADRFLASKTGAELAPFLQYNIENVRFWMRELTTNPWLIPQMHRLAEERPELKVSVGKMFGFLEQIGIDARTIDLVGKTNWFDFLSKFRSYEPAWVRDNKARLGLELANVIAKSYEQPEKSRDVWIKSQLEARPELSLYKRYIEQGMAAHLVGYSLKVFGANAGVEWLVRAAGMIPNLRRQGGLLPQQEIIQFVGREIALRLGVPAEQLVGWFREPSEQEIKREMQRLEVEASKKGLPIDIRTPGALQTLQQQARDNVVNQRILDKVADLFVGGQWALKSQDDLRAVLASDPSFDPNNPRSRVELSPPASKVNHFLTTTGLDRDPGVPQEKAEAWATELARRELLRGPDPTTPEQRRQRQATFESLPEDLRQLRQTMDPVRAEMYQMVEDGFRTLDSMTSDEDKQRFWLSNTTQVRLMKAMMSTRFTSRERTLLNEVLPLSARETETWWKTMRQQDPEKANLFEQLFPRQVQTFRNRDIYPSVPLPVRASPNGQGNPTSGSQSVFAPTRNELPVLPGTPDAAAIAKALAAPPMPAVESTRTYSNDEVLQAISGQESSGNYSAIGGLVVKGRGRAIGRYQFMPGTIMDLAGGKYRQYFDSANPNDYQDPVQAAKLAKRFLSNPAVQDAAAQDLLAGNAAALFGREVANRGQYTQEQVRLLAVSWVGGVGLAKDVRSGASDPSTVPVGDIGTTKVTVADYMGGVARRLPSGSATTTEKTDIRQVPVESREQYRVIEQTPDGKDFTIVYKGNIVAALKAYIRQVNPTLDPKIAQRITDTIMDIYTAANNPSIAAHSFDPLWIVAIMAGQSGFNPDQVKNGRFGLGGLLPHQAQLTPEEMLDPAKNTRVTIEWFKNLQRTFGTQKAVEMWGLDFVQTNLAAGRVLGLRPVWVGPVRPGGRALHEKPDTEEERKFATFFNDLRFAGGNREEPGFEKRRDKDWADLASKADSKTLERLKIENPDLFYHVQAARAGKTQWWQGRVALEYGDRDYLAWKHRVFGAESWDAAAVAYKSGPEKFREQFIKNNGDMGRFFQDYTTGVTRDYGKWEFSDDSDPEYLNARHKLGRAMGSGDPAVIKRVLKEIRSMNKDDVGGFLRKLKNDSPAIYESLKPYLETPVYGPDEQLRVQSFQTAIDDLIQRSKSDPSLMGQAAAIWKDPNNAGLLEMAREHATPWFGRTFAMLSGETPAGSYIRPEEHIPFSRFLNAMGDARQAKDSTALRNMWQSAPEHFRREYMQNHSARFANDEAILNGEDPREWAALKQKRLYEPYKDFLQANDAYGAFSPEKLDMIDKESPGASAYLRSSPEIMEAVRNGIHSRLSALYTGILRQYNYNPAILNAIPDDGTRDLIGRMDPAAKQAFEQHRLSVKPMEFTRIKSVQELFGETATVSPEVDAETGQRTGRFLVTRSATDPASKYGDVEGGLTNFAVDAVELRRQMGYLDKMPPLSPELKRTQEQFRRHQGIVQGLGLVYQGIQISQQGGGFMEQLPSYFAAAQAAASAGLFTGPLAGLIAGPWGLLAGGVLGILGGIFGGQRRAAEERRQREAAEKERQRQIDEQNAVQREQLKAQLRSIDKRELLDVEKRTGAIGKFLEQPTAITRQALLDAMRAPRPTW